MWLAISSGHASLAIKFKKLRRQTHPFNYSAYMSSKYLLAAVSKHLVKENLRKVWLAIDAVRC